jgi:amidase
MRFPEYDRLDALALAALVARREVSARDLLEAAIERADARGAGLNAIVARYDAEARARAAGPLPSGPLSGVPFLLKDHHAAWRGHPLTSSSRLLEGFVPGYDAEVVRRFEAAGLLIFGQTNTPELGIMGTTEPRLRGPTRNPWDLSRSTGGSSGGAAAAVAARIVPAAHATDGGGSIRIPSAWCGVFGLKPTRGRISLAPALGESWSGLDTHGVITRSVRDAAAFLDLLAGPVSGDPYALAPPGRPFLEEVGAPPGRLRVAFTLEPLFARATDPACAAAVEEAARLLESLGHEVVESRPVFPREALVRAYLVVVAAGVAAEVEDAARQAGRRAGPGLLEPETWALCAAGRTLSAAELALAELEIHRAAREVGRFFERHDLLLTSTTARPAHRLGALASSAAERVGMRLVSRLGSRRLVERLLEEVAARSFDATGNTMLFNETGQPAASLPLHHPPGGVPVGVQLAARYGEEATLLRVAAQMEAARPWADRAPAFP